LPTYIVHAPEGLLSTLLLQRRQQAFFAQVMFHDHRPGNWYLAGAPENGTVVFVQGFVRAGRSSTMKHRLLAALIEVVADGALVPTARVWGYLAELPAELMAEYGRFLPPPGGEAEWLDGLPAAERAWVMSTSHFV
jgi:hypothetical protein